MTERQIILKKDGLAVYLEDFIEDYSSRELFDILFNQIAWRQERIWMFGKEIITKRKVAFYADSGISYTYSKTKKNALSWNSILLEIKNQIEKATNERFNACLLNLYHDGNEGMGWHSDDEPEIVTNSTIASLSFGVTRKFVFKHKLQKDKREIYLKNNSLLLMKNEIQKYWLHALPKSKKIFEPRINLTFRQIK